MSERQRAEGEPVSERMSDCGCEKGNGSVGELTTECERERERQRAKSEGVCQ